MIGECVDECAGEVAHGRVYHHTGDFVDHYYVIVLIDDVDGNVLGHNLIDIGRVWEEHRDKVSGLDIVAGLAGRAVDEDARVEGGELYLGATHARQPLLQELVDAHRLLSGIDGDAVPLIELVFVRARTGQLLTLN